ncbi:ShlB/FhaC/HecB family hemolysin secretion/activation protein [Aquibaculum sediminis]|uniref:ShlB/FhaC/HecB family hemolysin secretion/activation protein n=1 Tax=Aquibaculum sediminis TaxID=3231907 RepID=UPI003455B2B0
MPKRCAAPQRSPLKWLRRRAGLCLVLLLVAACLAGVDEAHAQNRAIQSVIVEQNRVIQEFRPPLEMQRRIALSVPLERRSLVDLPEAAFRLTRVEISGAEFLTRDDLAPLWQPLLEQNIGRRDIEALIESIERYYRESDVYARALVTSWNTDNGVLSIEVFEGYLEEVRIESEIPDITERLQPYIDRMVGQVPLRVSQLERQLLLIADLEGIDVDALLEQVPERVGAGRLTLVISRIPSSAVTQLDNLTNEDSGPLQLTLVGTGLNLLDQFEQSMLVGVVNPITPRRFRLGQFTQSYPLGTHGLSAGYSLTYVRSAPGGDARKQDLQVDSRVGTLWLKYPFLRRIQHNLIGQVELTGQNDNIRAGSLEVVDDRKRWLSVSASYDRSLTRGGLLARLNVSQGLNALGATAADDPMSARFKGRPDFSLVSSDLNISHGLTDTLRADFGARGQVALTRLPSAARLSVGSDSLGRGFAAASLSGDSGVTSSLTLVHDLASHSDALSGFSAFAFGDHAWLRNQMDDMDFRSAHVTAVGVGITYQNYLQVGISTPAYSSRHIDDLGTRAFFKLSYQF